jgi:16S rRNA (cytosine1402-N4)-methyltransferase
MNAPAGHLPVLAKPVVDLLQVAPGHRVLDCTAGRGGHAELLARAVGPSGQVILMDRDAANLAHATARVAATGTPVHGIHGSFANCERAVAQAACGAGIRPPHGAVDRVLADLGFASNQMDDPARGFSFQHDGPLDMRLDPSQGESAAELLARLPERDLADAIFRFGEDPFARRIARVIVDRRGSVPLRTTGQLASAVVAAYGAKARHSRMHPATRTFMALRILVNDELGALAALLDAVGRGARAAAAAGSAPADDGHARPGEGWLAPGARVALISFHSLEDRMVKHAFAELERQGVARRITRKPVEADESEMRLNPRSRSAKLRVIEVSAEIVTGR